MKRGLIGVSATRQAIRPSVTERVKSENLTPVSLIAMHCWRWLLFAYFVSQLHKMGFVYKKAKLVPGNPDELKQEEFVANWLPVTVGPFFWQLVPFLLL